MFIFSFLASCFISIFNTLNLFVFPDTNLGFGTILLGLTMFAAIIKFIGTLSNSRMSLDTDTSSSGVKITNSPGSAVAISRDR